MPDSRRVTEDRDRVGSGESLPDTTRPRTSGDAAQQPSVQIALVLLMVLLTLLALWIVWSLIAAA